MDVLVVLFLAHTGVSQPWLWTTWLEKSSSRLSSNQKILLLVHCPDEKGDDFSRRHRLDLEFKSTSWCSPSLAVEYLRMLEATLAHGEVASSRYCTIVLVSGTDVPVRNGASAFRHVGHSSVCVGDPRSGGHLQWNALSKQDADTLVRRWNALSLDQRRELALKYMRPGVVCLDNHIITELLGNVESLRRSRIDIDCPYHHEVKIFSASPVEWVSFKEPFPLYKSTLNPGSRDELQQVLHVNLVIVLLKACMEKRYYFFRKVLPSCTLDAETERLFTRLYEGKEEVRRLLQEELDSFCERRYVVDDQVVNGGHCLVLSQNPYDEEVYELRIADDDYEQYAEPDYFPDYRRQNEKLENYKNLVERVLKQAHLADGAKFAELNYDLDALFEFFQSQARGPVLKARYALLGNPTTFSRGAS